MNAISNLPSAPLSEVGFPLKKQRKDEISLCSIIFCLLVIFIHVSSEPVNAYRIDSVQYIVTFSLHRLASFVVQGFLFLSGVKLFVNYRADRFSYGKFYLSRLRRVVLPYLAAVAVFYAYYLIIGVYKFSFPNLIRHLFFGDLVSHFYFVVIICQFYLLMPLWRLLAKRANPTITLICSLILMLILKQHLPEILQIFGLPWFDHNDRLFTSYIFYFVLGVFAGLHYESFLKMLRTQTKFIAAAWVVSAAVNCLFLYWINIGKYYPYWLENFHILYCFLSILLSLTLAHRICSTDFYQNKLRSAVSLIDKATYHIYLIHPIFIFIADQVMHLCGTGSISLRYLIRIVVVYTLSLSISLLWKIQWRKDRSS